MANANSNTLQIIARNQIGKVIQSQVIFYEPNAIIKRADQLLPGDIFDGRQIISVEAYSIDNDMRLVRLRGDTIEIFGQADLVLVDAQSPFQQVTI